ncbi:response regulator transcription factor [Chloroflexota bacterium]
MKVLIAEDSTPILERLRDLLGELNGLRNIGEAWDGIEATHWF